MAFTITSGKPDGSKTRLAMGMIAAIRTIVDKRKYMNIRKPVEVKELSDIINRELNTNLKVMINPSLHSNANMSIPLLTANNPMWAEAYREWFPKELGREGTKLVDKSSKHIIAGEITADGKLSGFLAKVEGVINISYDMIHTQRWKLTAAGGTGIILHEIGHFVNYLRAITWTCRTNYVLHQLNTNVMGNQSRTTKLTMMKRIAKAEQLDIDDDIDQIAKMDNDKTIITVFVDGMTRKMRSELGDDVYNARGFESLSDNFAAQHGCGLDLVLALDTMPGMGMAKKGTASNLIVTALVTATQLIGFISSPVIYSAVVAIIMCIYDPSTVIYDNPADRYRRVNAALVSKLRDNRGKDNARLIKEIEQIDDVISKYTNARGYYQTLYEYLTPGGRGNYNLREINQTLEDLSSNKLYVAAAKFQQHV